MKENLPSLIEVKPLTKYRLSVKFSDGASGIVDLSEYANKGVFSLWKEYRLFEKVAIGASGELVWSDRVDMDGLAIYLKLTGKRPEEVLPRLRELSDA